MTPCTILPTFDGAGIRRIHCLHERICFHLILIMFLYIRAAYYVAWGKPNLVMEDVQRGKVPNKILYQCCLSISITTSAPGLA